MFDRQLRIKSRRAKPQTHLILRAVARALIGGVYEYSYIRVTPDEFLLRSVVFKLIPKEISRAEHEYTVCIKKG